MVVVVALPSVAPDDAAVKVVGLIEMSYFSNIVAVVSLHLTWIKMLKAIHKTTVANKIANECFLAFDLKFTEGWWKVLTICERLLPHGQTKDLAHYDNDNIFMAIIRTRKILM